jgi:plasmid maintenance system antidote protein VapI
MATKNKITPIKSEQLKYLVEDVRAICNHYITENNLSVHAFAKQCAVHPNQMYMFLNNERGLNLTTVQKIGDLINQ